jgi:diguanylate cyclase (GGDEF)-like protein
LIEINTPGDRTTRLLIALRRELSNAEREAIARLARLLARTLRLVETTRKLHHSAMTDHLTGLPNRRAFESQLESVVARARRYREPLSLLMMDLNRFKWVNDNLGHAAGDRCLVAFADVLRQCLRKADIYARWGGDEFVALLPVTNRRAAARTAQRIGTTAQARRGHGQTCIEPSIGVASFHYPSTGQYGSATALLLAADSALRTAKLRYREQWRRAVDDLTASATGTASAGSWGMQETRQSDPVG